MTATTTNTKVIGAGATTMATATTTRPNTNAALFLARRPTHTAMPVPRNQSPPPPIGWRSGSDDIGATSSCRCLVLATMPLRSCPTVATPQTAMAAVRHEPLWRQRPRWPTLAGASTPPTNRQAVCPPRAAGRKPARRWRQRMCAPAHSRSHRHTPVCPRARLVPHTRVRVSAPHQHHTVPVSRARPTTTTAASPTATHMRTTPHKRMAPTASTALRCAGGRTERR